MSNVKGIIAANVAQFYQPNPSRPTATIREQLFAGVTRTNNKNPNAGGSFSSVPPTAGITKQFLA